jgi:preprotein translocase subunit SecE
LRAAAQQQHSDRPALLTRVKEFFRDSWLELQRVVWPTQENVVKMTGLVVAVVCIVGVFIFVWDYILATITRPLFR